MFVIETIFVLYHFIQFYHSWFTNYISSGLTDL